MKRAVEQIKTARIVVIGDLMLDRYWTGAATRISPEAPVPVLRVGAREERIGGAANVAANAVAVGAQVALCGLVGDDPDGRTLRQLCVAAGIRTLLHTCATATTVKLRVLAQHQQLLRLDFEEQPAEQAALDLLSLAEALFAGAGAIVLSDYAKGVLAVPGVWIERARLAGIPVVVDPKSRDFGRYAGADVLTPNLSEFQTVVGVCRDDTTLVERALALCAEHRIGALLITRGEQGMSLICQGQAPLHLPARARDVYDVTGAGDTVCALLACGLAAGLELAQATRLANVAAGVVVGKLGTAVVSNTELVAALEPDVTRRPAVLTRAALLAEIAQARRRNERIVMTNGCFDLLHAGHVRYLNAAAGLGSRLLVAVNSDASVQRLKGPTRPINPLHARMEVLAGLRSVDWVTSFEEDTPQDLIELVAPDVLVKGEDYATENIVGAAAVLARGGQVLTLPYHSGYSSTRLIAASAPLDTPP
jgi:D-beta-D-heptose 7-phosphate kinase/D-beta-D-heptose 1-phosphate adenosyltransferase